jgi:hypothetical protein
VVGVKVDGETGVLVEEASSTVIDFVNDLNREY